MHGGNNYDGLWKAHIVHPKSLGTHCDTPLQYTRFPNMCEEKIWTNLEFRCGAMRHGEL